MSGQQQAPRTCERILACRRVRDVDQYLVKFVGASLSQSVWLVEGDLDPDVVTQYRILAKLDRPVSSSKPLAAEEPHGDGEGKEEKRSDPEPPLQPAVNDEEEDDSWRWPSTDGAASVTRLTPFVFDPKAESPSWLATPPREAAISAIRPSELLPAEHCRALTDAYMAWRKSPMVVPASSLFRTTATVRLPRARTPGAERLGLSNARYLLGALLAMGYPRAHLSLHMYAFEEVCRGFFACLESGRKLGAERRYQLVSELRSLTWHLASSIRQNLDAVPSAALVEGLLAEASKEKRAAARKREHIDADDLVEAGKWLTPADQEALSAAIKTYFNAERLNPTVLPSDDDAWQAQGHLILHLLNDSCVAVPRSELLGSLVRGSSFEWDKDRGQWAMKMDAGQGKTKSPMLAFLPRTSNAMVRAWLKYYRPVLVKVSATHQYVFVHKNGTAPRTSFSAQMRALQHAYIGKSAAPHSFRGMQATGAHDAGLDPAEHAALCWGRQHTVESVKRFYERPRHKRLAELSEQALEKLRNKRARLALEGDRYVEAQDPLTDEE